MKSSALSSLRARLLVLVLLAAIPALAMIVHTGLEQRKQAQAMVVSRAQQIVDLASKNQQQLIQETRQLMMVLAQVPPIRNGDGSVCGNFLVGLLKEHPRYANFGVMRKNGDIFCSALPWPTIINSADRLYFRRVLETHNFSIGEYQIGRITGKGTINLGYPVLDAAGNLQRVIFAAIDLAWLNQLTADMRLPDNSSLIIVDHNGTVLVHQPNPSHWLGQSIVTSQLFKKMRGRTEGIFQILGPDKIDRLYAFGALQDAGGKLQTYLAVGIPSAVAIAEVNGVLLRNLMALVGVTLLLLTAAWIGGDVFILRRVSALLNAVRRVDAGDLSARSGMSGGRDEISELARAFDGMTARLEQRNIRIKENETRIARLSRVYAVLAGINSAMMRVRERSALLQETCRIAVEEGRFKLAWIGVIDAESRMLVAKHIVGNDTDYPQQVRLQFPAEGSNAADPVSAALRGAQAIVCNDIRQDMPPILNKAAALQRGYRSCALLPLQLSGQVIGYLNLYADEAGVFDADEMKLLHELAADVSLGLEYIEKEEKLHNLAYYDLLTGLPNRSLHRDRLEQSLTRAKHHARHVAVMTLHIDRLKEVNSIHGQHVGDMLLREVARRLQNLVRQGDTVGRAGSSAFGIILTDIAHTGDVILIARKIINAFTGSISFDGVELFVTVRIGIAVYPDDGDDIDTVLKNAEVALNIARRETDNNYRFYTPEINTRALERFEVERELRHALERNELALHYQPIVDINTRKIIGCEALLRWQNAKLGAVPPTRFIPVAEETDMIVPIGEWVLRSACEQGREWHKRGLAMGIAVNISAKQMRRADFAETVLTILKETEFDPESFSLTMEITENELMENAEKSAALLKNLQSKGLSVSIDDFGTGYSSLSYLKKLPVDSLKIDISFIRDITTDRDDPAIVKAIIALAHSLDMGVIAEGVETQKQFTALRELGCNAVQGFLFSPAVPPAEFEKLYSRSLVKRA
ncbi:MAG: EAL domain-containing protein [Gammaproteobacteria bacterium]|nr:EAL domain-containing protein [Gammaproteobacteria bacterium]